jgi:hypothetical protein
MAIVGSSKTVIITSKIRGVKTPEDHNLNCYRFENIEFQAVGILLLALNERAKRNEEHEASILTEICSNTECTRIRRKQTNMVAQLTLLFI